MESSDDGSHDCFAGTKSLAAQIETSVKNAREALAATRWEKRIKVLTVETTRRKPTKKVTLQTYFSSTHGSGTGQPLSMVLDCRFLDVLGAESDRVPKYPSSNSTGAMKSLSEITMSVDTETTIGSSSSSGGTQIVSSKSPLIVLPESSEDNDRLKEVPNATEVEFDEADSPPKKKGATAKMKAETGKSKAQQRYDRHRKFQFEWAAKLPWAEGILSSDGVLHMVKCKVCSAFDRKACIMAPKLDTLFKHDGKRVAKKDLPQFGVKKGDQYIASQCKHRKNLRLYAARTPSSVLEQVNSCTTVESRRKRVQFATLF